MSGWTKLNGSDFWLTELIRKHKNPRDGQTRVGPSEVGTPCRRRLALSLHYEMIDHHPRGGVPATKWKPLVGTIIHEFIATQILKNGHTLDQGRQTILAETPVVIESGVGTNGSPWFLGGTVDIIVLDHAEREIEVWDIKGQGAWANKAANRGEVNDHYEPQLLLYGLGAEKMFDYECRSVGIYGIRRDGELEDSVPLVKDFDHDEAEKVLRRYRAARRFTEKRNLRQLVLHTDTADDWCQSCPFLGHECGGHSDSV